MKYLLVLVVCCLGSVLFGSTHMTRVEPGLFINHPKTDFEAIRFKNENLKKILMKELFALDLVDHFGSHAFDLNAEFDDYYERYRNNYYCLDLDRDSVPELVFSGFFSPEDDREIMEIYSRQNGKMKNVFKQVGHLMAYKIQPNTNEILLYHHQYPCCDNASHNLNRLRLINHKVKQLKQFFIGKETDLVGPFFPAKSVFTSKNYFSKKEIELRWSPAKVDVNAWNGRTPSNLIARYASNSVYTVLAKKGKWKFVLVKAVPLADKKNRVINPDNFKDIFVFGWINTD